MKKLYGSKNPNKRIHPSPLSLLPSALMALASALSPDDQLVLSYLLTSHSHQRRRVGNQSQDQGHAQGHAPDPGCSCFSCYKSFWARWDSSPDRHVIHAILDAFEEEEDEETSRRCSKKKKKKDGKGKSKKKAMEITEEKKEEEEEEQEAAVVVQEDIVRAPDHENEKTHDDGREEGDEKSSVRRFFGWVFGINN